MYPANIKQLHIELTDKCQASCPMCLRNYNGGAEREFVRNVEITLDEFKQWFPVNFIKNLETFFTQGALGEPAIAKDCLEIFEYVRANNPTAHLAIHTNGSVRTPSWWADLAKVLGKNSRVIFAIDGFKGEHEIYRRGTSWNKIIENAWAFTVAGGTAYADCLVFKHNEDRIEELQKCLLAFGFSQVNVKLTERFYGDDSFPVLNKNGEQEYLIHPPEDDRWKQDLIKPNIIKLANNDNFNNMLAQATIDPICIAKQGIYVDANGNVFPCCNVSSIFSKPLATPIPELALIRSRLNKSTKDLINDIGLLNLHGTDVVTLLRNSKWAEELPKHWQDPKTFSCVKTCATNIRSIIE